MLEVVPVRAFKDNYVWTMRNATHAAVVDPGEAQPVLDYLGRENLELAAILATHHWKNSASRSTGRGTSRSRRSPSRCRRATR